MHMKIQSNPIHWVSTWLLKGMTKNIGSLGYIGITLGPHSRPQPIKANQATQPLLNTLRSPLELRTQLSNSLTDPKDG